MIKIGVASTNPLLESWFRNTLNDSNDFFLSYFTNPFEKDFFEKWFEAHDVLLFHTHLIDNTLNPISFALRKYFSANKKPIVILLENSQQIDLSNLMQEIPIIEVLRPAKLDSIDVKDQLKEALKIAGYVSPETLTTFTISKESQLLDSTSEAYMNFSLFKVLLIGASTGGPKVIIELLKNLKPVVGNFAIVIAQHISHIFLDQFKNELEKVVEKEIQIIGDNIILEKGKIYLTPVQRQFVFGAEMKFIPDPVRHLYPFMPNIDVIFTSISSYFKNDVVYLILSGLGNDGASAAELVMKNDGVVIAQNLQSTEVDSMPRTVIENGNYTLILNPKEMVQYLTNLINKK